MKDPLRVRPTNKKAYVASAVVWAVAITVAISFLIWGRNNEIMIPKLQETNMEMLYYAMD